MNLVYGVALMCLAAILFGVEMIFFRNPKLPKWAEGFVCISTAVIVIIGLGSTGFVLVTFAMQNFKAISWHQMLMGAAMVSAAALILWRLRIPKKLRAYAEQEAVILSFKEFENQYGPENGLGPDKGRMAA